MRLSVVLLVASLMGVIGGAYLAGGLTGVGAAVIFDSLFLGWYALERDDGTGSPAQPVHGAPTVNDILDRHRQAS